MCDGVAVFRFNFNEKGRLIKLNVRLICVWVAESNFRTFFLLFKKSEVFIRSEFFVAGRTGSDEQNHLNEHYNTFVEMAVMAARHSLITENVCCRYACMFRMFANRF